MNEVISKKVKEGELPEEVEMVPILTLPEKYFEGEYHLPNNLRPHLFKSEEDMEKRVRIWLETCTVKSFEEIGDKVDATK